MLWKVILIRNLSRDEREVADEALAQICSLIQINESAKVVANEIGYKIVEGIMVTACSIIKKQTLFRWKIPMNLFI